MAAMTKYVNVRTVVAVRNIDPPICGTYSGIMTTGDILKCLCKRAKVDEVLPDGRIVHLNMSNYYLDNGAGLDARVHHPVVKEVVENPKRFTVPVAKQAQVVETKIEEPVQVEVKEDVSVTVTEEVPAEEVDASLPVVTTGQMSVVGEEDVVEGTIATIAVAEDIPEEEVDEAEALEEDEETDGEEETEEAATENQSTNPNTNNSSKKKKKKNRH